MGKIQFLSVYFSERGLMEKKSYLSKSMWLGLLIAVSGLLSSVIPSFHEWVISNNEFLLMAIGVVSMGLRAVTKDKIVLW
ncbi:hypothetical protein EB077_13115 [bacterium]|nr:hypothetical protein [bacterium]NDG27853.1 hypothetical protein [Pseudomonadota bacterium]